MGVENWPAYAQLSSNPDNPRQRQRQSDVFIDEFLVQRDGLAAARGRLVPAPLPRRQQTRAAALLRPTQARASLSPSYPSGAASPAPAFSHAHLARTSVSGPRYSVLVNVSVRDLRDDAGRVLDRVERGETLKITRNGRPVAELRPLPRRARSIAEVDRRLAALPAMDEPTFRRDIGALIDPIA